MDDCAPRPPRGFGVFVNRQSYLPATRMDWTRVPAIRYRKCRGKNAGVAWVVNFNNGNCNNNLNNNNYVRAVR